MSKEKRPTTPAILALKAHGAVFSLHPYAYEEKGGTRVSAQKLGVDEHCVIKTLVMEDETAQPLIILMHGDKMEKTIAVLPEILINAGSRGLLARMNPDQLIRLLNPVSVSVAI